MSVLPRLLFFLMVVFLIAGCNNSAGEPKKLPVAVTTIFPVYDFTRTIAGDRMDVVMLLPPGAEAHHYEPRPEDMALVQRASVFVYTSSAMEPWSNRLLKGVDRSRLRVVEAAQPGSMPGADPTDPHVWLDLANAQRMVEHIVSALASVDPLNEKVYRQNGVRLSERLAVLDQRYKNSLSNCASRVLFHGGHASMGYLARRYNLEYRPATGVGGESEPTPAMLARLIADIKKAKATAVFSEEMVSPRIANTISAEAGGVKVLPLSAAHTVASAELSAGISFEKVMQANLSNLMEGLGCR